MLLNELLNYDRSTTITHAPPLDPPPAGILWRHSDWVLKR